MTQTAERWWVRVAARWLARVDGVSSQLRLAMLGLTGVSTMTLTLQSYGYGEFAPPLVVLLGIAGAVFAYLYTEGGVWNQMARDRQDLSANYAGPNARIQSEMVARCYLAGEKGEPLSDAEREAISAEADATFTKHRDGINLSDLDD